MYALFYFIHDRVPTRLSDSPFLVPCTIEDRVLSLYTHVVQSWFCSLIIELDPPLVILPSLSPRAPRLSKTLKTQYHPFGPIRSAYADLTAKLSGTILLVKPGAHALTPLMCPAVLWNTCIAHARSPISSKRRCILSNADEVGSIRPSCPPPRLEISVRRMVVEQSVRKAYRAKPNSVGDCEGEIWVGICIG